MNRATRAALALPCPRPAGCATCEARPGARLRVRRGVLAAGRALLAGLASGAVALGCASTPHTLALGAASPGRELTDVAELRELLAARGAGDTEAARGTGTASGSVPAFVVGASPDELIAARLDRPLRDARMWRAPLAPASQPALSGGLVVVGAERGLVGLSASDGRRLWQLPARGRVLLGATSDGQRLALLLLDRRGQRSLALYDLADEDEPRERLRVTASGALGTPALLPRTLLVPWGPGHLSAVDASKQREFGRVRIGEELLHAMWWEQSLFFGGPPWVEVTPGGAPPYTLPRRPLPGVAPGTPEGAPRASAAPGGAMPDAPDATSAAVIGSDVTRLHVWPAAAGSSGSGELYLGTYGRVAFGLEREQGALAWVAALPGRVLAALPSGDALLVCDESGGVRALSRATGRVQRQWQLERQRRITLGEPTLSGCALAPGRVLAPEPVANEPAPEPLLEQLARVLALSDPALTDAQRFLARELAAQPEPEATRLLIELVQRRGIDRVLQSEAEDLLATRRNGEDHMLAALSPSGSRGEEALPPIAPLGEALAALGEGRAAPLLARQLNRPAHTASAIARAAAALEQLASDAEYAELSVFFSLHRTNADGPEWVAAVISVGRTLLRVGGQRGRTLVQFATRDPLTIPEIKLALERELGTGAPAATSAATSMHWPPAARRF